MRFALLVVCLLAACAAKEVLLPRSAAVPAGIDLSGKWQLRNDVDLEQRRLNDAIRKTDGMDDRVIVRRPVVESGRMGQTNSRRRHGGLVHVFLQQGKMLKITQTNAGIFVSFDRAVVEEFRFGENREVHVGPVVASRVSGWDGREYVVETLGEEGMKLTERYAFGDNHDTLRRAITLRGRDMKEVTVVQLFDRIAE